MVRVINDIMYNDNDIDFLKNSINNFVATSPPFEATNKHKVKNYYHRMMLDENVDLLDYQNKLIFYLNKNFNLNVKIEGIWINKINNEYNKNDDYHLDKSDLTTITFLNDDFSGGEFEYIDDNDEVDQIKPKKGLSILQNNLLLHRVKNVIEGDRYTLVCFLKTETKNKKTLL